MTSDSLSFFSVPAFWFSFFFHISTESVAKAKFKVDIKDGDQDYLDAWDHVVVKMTNQYKSDLQFGIPFELGPVSARNVIDVEKTTQKKNGLFGTIHQ